MVAKVVMTLRSSSGTSAKIGIRFNWLASINVSSAWKAALRATYPILTWACRRSLPVMRIRILALVGALLLVGGSIAAAVLVQGAERHVTKPDIPGTPYLDVISPRDGSKPRENSVVVKVRVHNFTLAPSQFGKTPQLGEGILRFSLNKVPDSSAPARKKRRRTIHLAPAG